MGLPHDFLKVTVFVLAIVQISNHSHFKLSRFLSVSHAMLKTIIPSLRPRGYLFTCNPALQPRRVREIQWRRAVHQAAEGGLPGLYAASSCRVLLPDLPRLHEHLGFAESVLFVFSLKLNTS